MIDKTKIVDAISRKLISVVDKKLVSPPTNIKDIEGGELDYFIISTNYKGMNYRHWDFGDYFKKRMIRIESNDNPPMSIFFDLTKPEGLILSKKTVEDYNLDEILPEESEEKIQELLEKTGFGINWFIVLKEIKPKLEEERDLSFPKPEDSSEKVKKAREEVKKILESPKTPHISTPPNLEVINESGHLEEVSTSIVPLELDISVEKVLSLWKQFRELDSKLLDKQDYQETSQGIFKKKSAFRKYKTFYKLTDEILKEEKKFLSDGSYFVEFHVSCYPANNPSLKSIGVGIVHSKEKCKDTCNNDCTGLVHFSNKLHNIISTAHTRAKNRAISDLIAGGEVSWEEVS